MKTTLPNILIFIFTALGYTASAQCIMLTSPAEGETLCSYEQVILTATPGFDNYRFYYNFSDSNESGNLFIQGSGNTLILPAGEWAGSYWYVETGDPDCNEPSETLWWDSWFFQSPVVMHDANTTLCPGDSSQIEMPFGGPELYQWSKDFEEIPGADGPSYWVTAPGMYTVSVAYGTCPELWLSSGVGPVFEMYNVTPITITAEDEEGQITLTASHGTNIQWYLDGELLEGATGPTHVASEAGMYTATGLDNNGCALDSEPFMVNTLSASASVFSGLRVFPNPFSGDLQIETGDATVTSLRIFDLSGKLVNADVRTLTSNASLHLSDLENGVYFLEFTSAEEERRTVKILKQ